MSLHSRLSLLRTLGLSLPLLAGCGSTSLPNEAGPEPRTQAGEIRIANSLGTQALVLNAISTNATANALVASQALERSFGARGDAYLAEQLFDADARHFMDYLVGCALNEGESITWKESVTGTSGKWEGKIGLCPEWRTEAPSEECLRRVSACIVARNNAFGVRVELSLRGEDARAPEKFDLEVKTRPVEYEPGTSLRVASFAECATARTSSQRDCGWTADALGQCEPGEAVRLGAGNTAPDQCAGGTVLGTSAGARMVLRVCEGIAGCDDSSNRKLASSDGACGQQAPAVTFTCPASGYFNVMTAPWDSTTTGQAEVQVEEETPAATGYRISEQQSFLYREGAFFGTLFDPEALGANVFVRNGSVEGKASVVAGSVYKRMFSCYDSSWSRGEAYSTHRVCALPDSGENCAASVVGPCSDPETPDASVCALDDGYQVRQGDGDFEQCTDSHERTLWNEPVTVYLNGPCDLAPAGQPDLCVHSGNP